MTEPAKPKLRWSGGYAFGSEAYAGAFWLEVFDVDGGWSWDVYAGRAELLRNGRFTSDALPTREAAQVAAEDALREMLVGALKALDGGE